MNGYEYGNARLRARWGRLLAPADYSAMAAASDLDHLIGRLSASDYARDVEVSVPEFAGLRLVDQIVRHHLTRQLRDVRSFYREQASAALQPLLDRWDVRNLVFVLRGQIARLGSQEVSAMIVPAGRIGESMLVELAAQPGLRAAIDLMVAWSVPSRRVARDLAGALAAYERSGDLAGLEALVYTHRPEGRAAPEVEAALAGEVDERNLVNALRLRQSRRDGEVVGDGAWLPGGRVPDATLVRIVHTDEPATVDALIRQSAGRWIGDMPSWADLPGIEAQLRIARWRAEMIGYRRGDPLGAAIPVGFVAAKQGEAHDLRLLARGIVHRLPPDEVLERLVMM